jgi:hypothetical protein
MPDHLRVNRERHYGQTEEDEEIGLPEFRSVAEMHHAPSVRRTNETNFSLSRCSFGHAVCEKYWSTDNRDICGVKSV